ncbi:MAG: hypothetical protein IPO85_05620 [Saprospiraceae bacterium]|jgi:hypothetical protein|uniref:Lipoprotein n=1 Tax=Candidatus Defluviibacterium haderslevense TaxID=2981993 RepID=A0A9D7XDW6_9BACT|nr:hypothetical protein [Candidatus Defluviibacterium haderslevense]MBK7242416.1 hypothetical protein [Candidatus Defluviibacterium haderslevense]MBK9716981.1 hypothetical protein [Candidatus Defluviibacterium haderslevense]MCI1267922.1 hypothetical protein [Saprospiraceae bacterium]HRI34250.1 hypothetical protein [Saprospiraceae bacterium]
MKKLILLIAPVLFIVACKNVEQFRAPIEALTADWAKAGASVTEVGSLLNTTQVMMASMSDSLVVAPTAKLKPGVMASLDSIKTIYTNQLAGLGTLGNDLKAFSSSWQEMSTKVDALSAGLKSGKLDGDVMAQINELKTASTDAMSKADGWKSAIEAAKTAAMGAYDLYKTTSMSK